MEVVTTTLSLLDQGVGMRGTGRAARRVRGQQHTTQPAAQMRVVCTCCSCRPAAAEGSNTDQSLAAIVLDCVQLPRYTPHALTLSTQVLLRYL